MRTALKKTTQLDQDSAVPQFRQPMALFLDFDGTLVDFAETPNEVIVDASVTSLLVKLHIALDGAVALVSGRSIGSLRQLLAPTVLAMAGQHGLEIYRPGMQIIDRAMLPKGWNDVVQRLERFVSGRPGLLLEHKGFACAVHYRRRPELESEVIQAVDHLTGSLPTDVVPQHGKYVVEIKAASTHKGEAVQWFMNRRPFAGRYPVFIGDDATDEDGFRTAISMGGGGIVVGGFSDTCANGYLSDVEATKRWLSDIAESKFSDIDAMSNS